MAEENSGNDELQRALDNWKVVRDGWLEVERAAEFLGHTAHAEDARRRRLEAEEQIARGSRHLDEDVVEKSPGT